nr:MAG TPA: hypothetical protein [Crassvirales sp.]
MQSIKLCIIFKPFSFFIYFFLLGIYKLIINNSFFLLVLFFLRAILLGLHNANYCIE